MTAKWRHTKQKHKLKTVKKWTQKHTKKTNQDEHIKHNENNTNTTKKQIKDDNNKIKKAPT